LSQDDFNLIDEATRIRTQSGIAHAKKAALRLAVSDYPNDSTKDLALSEIIRALNLNPESDEVLLYAATVYESLGYQKESESLFSRIISLDGINIDALLSLISVQDKLNTNDESKRMILNLAIAKVAKSDSFLREKLTIKRFESAVNSGDFIRVLDDWNLIKDWKGASDSFGLFLKAVENEADKLIRENRYNEAIDLIKPSAIASLTDTKNQNFSSLLTKLIELENRDNPPFTIVEKDSMWHYLDDGNDPGTNWFELSAATQDWSKGKAKFGYGDDGEITTLSYGADLGNKHLAYYLNMSSKSIPIQYPIF
jgi:tetratricopeptide (TPR) repeat protein